MNEYIMNMDKSDEYNIIMQYKSGIFEYANHVCLQWLWRR